jgi:hypothetical protein
MLVGVVASGLRGIDLDVFTDLSSMENLTVSKLIDALKEILEKHGDLKVYTYVAGDGKPAGKVAADTWRSSETRTTETVVFIE